jgi:hypothetical protein
MNILKQSTLILVIAATPGISIAQEGGLTAATAVAAGELVLKAISGLVSWIGGEGDNAAASAYESVSAKHDNFKEASDKLTGYYTAIARPDPAPLIGCCSAALAGALAQEGVLGAWWSETVDPRARAVASPLEGNISDDFHRADAFAQASVDGHVRTSRETTPSIAAAAAAPSGRAVTTTTENPGDVIAQLNLSNFSLRAAAGSGSASTGWKLTATANGQLLFTSSGSLDGAGNLAVSGDLPSSMFTKSFDTSDGSWGVTMQDFSRSFLLANLTPGEAFNVDANLSAELPANASLSSGTSVPEPSSIATMLAGLMGMYWVAAKSRGRQGCVALVGAR